MAKLSSFWCRLLLFLALLCVSPKVLARDIHYTDYTKLVKSPTFDKPWTEIKFMFFDEDGKGNDSFFQRTMCSYNRRSVDGGTLQRNSM